MFHLVSVCSSRIGLHVICVMGSCLSCICLNSDARADQPAIEVSDVVLHGDMECFRISTPQATYLYGKRGAGMASLIDSAGNDWISYRHGGKSQGEYRGLPKCGQPTKFFHCGYGFGNYQTDNTFTSTLAIREPAHVRIHSITQQKDAEGIWDFYPTHATFTLLKIPGNRHWFLYEGTPGGKLDTDPGASVDRAIRPTTAASSLDQPWKEVVPWVAFAASESSHSFFLVNHQTDSPVDSYVAWPYKATSSEPLHQMTVFGFGRPDWQDPQQHTPPVSSLPARYSIGFTAARQARTISDHLKQLGLIGANSESPPATKPIYVDSTASRRQFEQTALTKAGDPKKGEKLFHDTMRTKCTVCHRIEEVGGLVGPGAAWLAGREARAILPTTPITGSAPPATQNFREFP